MQKAGANVCSQDHGQTLFAESMRYARACIRDGPHVGHSVRGMSSHPTCMSALFLLLFTR